MLFILNFYHPVPTTQRYYVSILVCLLFLSVISSFLKYFTVKVFIFHPLSKSLGYRLKRLPKICYLRLWRGHGRSTLVKLANAMVRPYCFDVSFRACQRCSFSAGLFYLETDGGPQGCVHGQAECWDPVKCVQLQQEVAPAAQ